MTEKHTDAEQAAWLADKIGALGDYAKEAATMLRRWPAVGAPGTPAPTDKLPCVLGYATMCKACEAEGKCHAADDGVKEVPASATITRSDV
jgi:hypothetical protein